ncbi:MAG: hypothetical protein ACHQZR_04290, partial [Candidatus Limnocylindrales bacterium]
QYDYAASCFVVTDIAKSAGDTNMRVAIDDMLDRRMPYGATASDRLPAGPITWRQWLDTIDEVAMVPAGGDMDLAQSLLARFGVATDPTELAARSAARKAYHQFETAAPGWTMPTFISKDMADWRFSDATAALQVASSVRSLAEQEDAALAGADAVTGSVATRFAAARSLADLQAAQTFAQAQLDAARVVSTANAGAAQSRSPIEAVGLVGTDVGAMSAAGVHAVAHGDADQAKAEADQLDRVIAGAATVGLMRVGVGLVTTVLVIGGAFFVMRRRRRQRAAAAVVQAAGGELPPGTPGASWWTIPDAAGSPAPSGAAPAAATTGQVPAVEALSPDPVAPVESEPDAPSEGRT